MDEADMEDVLDEVMGEEHPPPAPPKMPQLPDGIGLDYKQVAALLSEKSKVIVEPDDPVMMLIPVLNCFLAEEEGLLKRHNETLVRVLGERADYYMENVKDASKQIKASLSSTALTAIQETFEQQKRLQAQNEKTIKWAAVIILIAALINIGILTLNILL